jgi:pre-60S factor REI1
LVSNLCLNIFSHLQANPKPETEKEAAPIESPVKYLKDTPNTSTQENPVDSGENRSIEAIIDEKIKNAQFFKMEECIFCNIASPDLATNVEHMTNEHGFFIPDLEYLKDMEGLIKYLGEKVSVGNVCLYCNGKGRYFRSAEACQKHMRDTSHCKLLYDGNEEEYEDYYDFSADYGSADPTVEVGDIKPTVEVSVDGSELIFSNGKTVGHRSLKVYYNQNVRLPDTRECVVVNRIIQQYKLLGWKTNEGNFRNSKSQKDHEILRREKNQSLRVGMNANKLMKWFKEKNGITFTW